MRSVASFNAPWPTACAAGASSALDAYHTPPPPPATPFAVGDDFLLHPELSTAPVDDVNLIRLQARRGRTAPTPAFMSNKLLMASLFRSLRIQTPATLYGAFFGAAMGEWPRYDRAALVRAARASGWNFVLKSATGSGATNRVLLMDAATWAADGWTPRKLGERAEALLARNVSEWGEAWEHRGILLQERLRQRLWSCSKRLVPG